MKQERESDGRNDFHSVFMCRHLLMVRIVECGWPLNLFSPSSRELMPNPCLTLMVLVQHMDCFQYMYTVFYEM